MASESTKAVKFSLRTRKHRAALRYALDHGFDTLGAMARVALFQYLGKHPKDAKKKPKRPEEG